MVFRECVRAAVLAGAGLVFGVPAACGGEGPDGPRGPSGVAHLLDLAEGLKMRDELVLYEADFSAGGGIPEGWVSPPDEPGTFLGRSPESAIPRLFEVEVLEGPAAAYVVHRAGPLDGAPHTPEELSSLARALRELPNDRPLTAWAGGGESTVMRLNIQPLDEDRRAGSHVVFAVVAPEGPGRIGRVVLRRPPVFQRASNMSIGQSLAGFADVPTLERVNIGGDHRPSLVLPSGSSFSIEAELPADARELELGIGALQGVDPRRFTTAALAVSAAVDGAEQLVENFELDPGRSVEEVLWRTLWIDVEDLAGMRVTFHLRAEGKPGDAVAVAHPRVLGARELDPRPNLILISLDTLRADRVGATGGTAGLTPNIDALAARGLAYPGAHSTAPYTLPAHGSIFTGQLPSEHGAIGEFTRLRSGEVVSAPHLGRILRDHGWTTAAFTGGGWLSPEFGFADGFDVYGVHDFMIFDSMLPRAPGRDLEPRATPLEQWPDALRGSAAHRTRVETVQDWLETHRDRPFFLFLHSFATHEFAPPPEFLERFVGEEPEVQWGSGWELAAKRTPGFFQQHEFSPAEIDYVQAVYDATVAHADRELGRLFEALDEAELTGNTLIVLTSDHGEEFFEHGWFGHGRTLYQDMLRVPLVISGPGVPTGVVDEPVSLIDLAPTVLGYLGLEPDPRMKGAALPTPENPRAAAGPLFHEVHLHTVVDSLRAGRWKLIHNRQRPRSPAVWELYDLDADPLEQLNLAQAEPRTLGQMQQLLLDKRADLDQLMEALGRSATSVSQETQNMLRDLGY